ncbi:MAG: protein translocase subunit SecD [Lachnospiraceae bacterium]|nr:protein translocase subunit SecD [Lachnospiraceae bacterium]
MKDKTKGWLMILGLVLIIAGIAFWGATSYIYDDVTGVKDVSLGLDLAGGVSVTYQTVKEDPTSEEMEDLQTKLEKRATSLSTEARVYREGKRRINVDIPGMDDAKTVFDTLGDAGNIYFIYAVGKDGTSNIKSSTTAESGYELARDMKTIIEAGDVVIDGSDIASADPATRNDNGAIVYEVVLELNEAGGKKFEEATGYCAGKTYGSLENIIAIVYDNVVYSAPNVKSKISGGSATITGSRNMEEARSLSTIIRIGALPIEIEALRSNVVGATLGSRALRTSLIAGVIGLALVCLYMIVFYRVPGVAASLSLLIYLGLMLAMLLAFHVTLTLPGIAGIILSIGMAVDANVIIFTRIREELATGKTVRSSVKIGYRKAVSAIIDGNVTTLIAAIVLYFRGSGVIKGFATTLGIGIVISMFTAFVITYFIMKAFYYIGIDKVGAYGVAKERKTLRIIQNWKKYVIISGSIIALCIVMLIVNKSSTGNALNYGLDFVGGTSVQVTFNGNAPSNADMERFVSDTISENATVSAVEGRNILVVKTKSLNDQTLDTLKKSLMSTYQIGESDIETETISGVISGEMKSNAIVAVLVATVCMLIYILIRFSNMAFAASSVLALIHDILVVLCLYAVIRLTVDTSFIACMLTIVGYSINATIVIFDRLRENLGAMKKHENLADVVNRSITETFTRSIHTSVTTLITVVMLIILGVESVRIFAIPMAVGILCGGYSSVCIAGSLWYFFKTRKKSAGKAVTKKA